MSNLKDVIETIGRDIGEIKGKQSTSLSISQAYGLFPTIYSKIRKGYSK